MNVLFADGALAKLRYLALSDEAGSGFLKTERIGQYIIITDLIGGNVLQDSSGEYRTGILDLWGNAFGGVFIKGDMGKVPEHYLEKRVLNLTGDYYEIYYYDSDSRELISEEEGRL